jgi:hypothetical protein
MNRIAVLAVCIGLAAAAKPVDANLFSSTGLVIAILDDDLFVGEAEGHLNGAGTLTLQSQKAPTLTCMGKFTSSAALGGTGQMQCSDGATATFHFQRLGVFRGYGTGTFSRGSMSFAYGFSADEAGPYLKLPEGKRLVQTGTGPKLVDLMEGSET